MLRSGAVEEEIVESVDVSLDRTEESSGGRSKRTGLAGGKKAAPEKEGRRSVSAVKDGKRKTPEEGKNKSARKGREKEKVKNTEKVKGKDKDKRKKEREEVERAMRMLKKMKLKRKQMRVSSSSSSSSENSDSAASGSSEGQSKSEEGSSSSGDSSSSEGPRRGRSGRRSKKLVDMELLEDLWPREDRPKKLQSKKGLVGLSMSELMRLKEQFVKEAEKKGMGSAVFGRDCKPKKKKFAGMTDDGEVKLHPARFESLPRSEPSKYWKQVPAGRTEIFRHLPLEHLGVEGVAETTVVKLHNRRVPVELSMLREDITEVRHVQEAVYNYVALLRSLHPADYGGLVILKVLTDAGWAVNIGDGDKQRVGMLRKFFDDVTRENSGRAVRLETPLTVEQGKARWLKTVAAVLPNLSYLGMGQQLAAMSAGGGKAKAGKQGKQSGGGGGPMGQGGFKQNQPAHQKQNQGAAGGGGGGGGGLTLRTPARHNGMPVCFGYNNGNCTRLAPGTQAKQCVDGSMTFAHVCNFYVKGVGHCLADHPKAKNH